MVITCKTHPDHIHLKINTANIVPTSGIRGVPITSDIIFSSHCRILLIACTAAVTEIGYHNNPTIDATIIFLSADEWKAELAVLLKDLMDGTGPSSADPQGEAAQIAWSKVCLVFNNNTRG
jgi:hypothetical protein